MKFVGSPRVAHRVGRYVASAVRHLGQLCTVVNPQRSTYRSGKVVQTNEPLLLQVANGRQVDFVITASKT